MKNHIHIRTKSRAEYKQREVTVTITSRERERVIDSMLFAVQVTHSQAPVISYSTTTER